jgi:hypothetical protein
LTQVLLALALLGTVWAFIVAQLASATLFGVPPTRADEAFRAGALCSAGSVWLVVAFTAVPLRRHAVVVVGLIVASGFAAVNAASHGTPFVSAAVDGWLSAWRVPTSWVLAVAAVAPWFPAVRRMMTTWRIFQ